MTVASSGASTPELLTSISHYLWPIVVLFILWRLLPAIREVIRTRDFKINVAGMSLDVQAASEGLQKQIADLQNQVAQLQEAPLPLESASYSTPKRFFSVARPDSSLAGPSRSTSAEVRVEQVSSQQISDRILWVDDEPENIAFEIQALETRGIDVKTARSTAEALKLFHSGRFFAAITDMGRTENGLYNPDAGLQLVKAVRGESAQMRLYVYTTDDVAAKRGDELLRAGANAVTSSGVRLLSVLGVIGSSTP